MINKFKYRLEQNKNKNYKLFVKERKLLKFINFGTFSSEPVYEDKQEVELFSGTLEECNMFMNNHKELHGSSF